MTIINLDFSNMSRDTALALADNGLPLTPIRPGTKAPWLKGWPNTKLTTPEDILSWLKDEKHCGIGVVCGHSIVAIDIDENDKRLAQFHKNLAFSHFGKTIARYGRYPRCVLPYAVGGEPIRSKNNKDVPVQIIGLGGQFVAYGYHPDTKKPYWYDDKEGIGLTGIRLEDLERISADQINKYYELIKKFARGGFFERVRHLPDDVWKLLERDQFEDEDRSSHQHKAIIKLRALQFSHEEIFWLIWSCPQGAGAKAHNKGEKWLRDTILREATDRDPSLNEATANHLQRLDQVEEKPLNWLWYPFFLKGAATFLDGIPGVAKSNFIKKVCHYLMDGLMMPNNIQLSSEPIIYYTGEEDASFIKTQLRIMGCKNLHNLYVCATPLKLDSSFDLQKIKNDVLAVKPGLVIFDIFMSYLSGKVESNISNKVAEPMSALKNLAQDYNFALALLRHTAKQENAIDAYKGQGSASLIGLARIGLLFNEDKDVANRRIVTFSKANYSPRDMQLDFTLESHEIEGAKPRQTIAIPEWGEWKKRETNFNSPKNLSRDESEKFGEALKREIEESDGMILSSEVKLLAKEYLLSEVTAFRKCIKMGYVKVKIGKAFYTGTLEKISAAKKQYQRMKK